MQTQHSNTAYSLYALYETLSNETQQQFLQELMQKQADKLEALALYSACQEAKEENEFLSDDEAADFGGGTGFQYPVLKVSKLL